MCTTDGPGGAAAGTGAPEGDAGGEDEEVRGQEAGGQEAGGEGRDEGGGAPGGGRAAAREDAGLGGDQAVPQHPAEHRAARGRTAEVGLVN